MNCNAFIIRPPKGTTLDICCFDEVQRAMFKSSCTNWSTAELSSYDYYYYYPWIYATLTEFKMLCPRVHAPTDQLQNPDVFLKNLPAGMQDNELYDLCAPYGSVTDQKVGPCETIIIVTGDASEPLVFYSAPVSTRLSPQTAPPSTSLA
eukprot:406146-Pelagomonas_calceolata.AAC.3